jgi:hypothetical protein
LAKPDKLNKVSLEASNNPQNYMSGIKKVHQLNLKQLTELMKNQLMLVQ